MVRGTTPTHVFGIPFDVTTIDEAWITYKQGDVEINKTIADCVVDTTANTLSVTLSQTDTLEIRDNRQPVQIQLRVLTNAGTALASQIMTVAAYSVLRGGVIGGQS